MKGRNYHLQFQLPAELIAKVIAIEGSNYQAGPEKHLLPTFGEMPAASWGLQTPWKSHSWRSGSSGLCPRDQMARDRPPPDKAPQPRVASPHGFLPQPWALKPLDLLLCCTQAPNLSRGLSVLASGSWPSPLPFPPHGSVP